jgi:hypothetical protein
VELLLPARFRSSQPNQPSCIDYRRAGQVRIRQGLCGLRKDESEFPLDVVCSPVETVGHHEVIVVLRDVTAPRSLEAQLRQHSEGQHHTECNAQISKLKREINALLVEMGKAERYDV